jgi:menaquinone-dependent protoporphyrinogen oxidase
MTRRRFVRLGAVAGATVIAGGGIVYMGTDAPDVELPESRLGAGEMKALVVYGTKSGCTTGIAEKIGATLAESGMAVDVRPVETAGDPGGYDAVVVGSGVRVGSWHAPVKEWVAANAGALTGLPVAFYTCCLTLATDPAKADEVRAYTDALVAESGVTPVDVGLFAGWNEPKSFSLLERTVMKVMKAPQGDFRDFEAVAAWAKDVAPRLGAA